MTASFVLSVTANETESQPVLHGAPGMHNVEWVDGDRPIPHCTCPGDPLHIVAVLQQQTAPTVGANSSFGICEMIALSALQLCRQLLLLLAS